MLSWEYPPHLVGGISPHVHGLSGQLAERGVEVHVVTQGDCDCPDSEMEARGVHVHRVRPAEADDELLSRIESLNNAMARVGRRLIQGWKGDGSAVVLHAHDWLTLRSAQALKHEFRIPLCATIHATESGRNGGLRSNLHHSIHEQEYWLTYEAWRVIVCSQHMRSEVQHLFGLPDDKIDAIPNGVDSETFVLDWTAAERRAWRARIARPDEQIVMYVGRFVREKGIHHLLEAAPSILASHPTAHFVIVGGGDRRELESFAQWTGIAEKVTFTGFLSQEELVRLYSVASCAAFPSLYEPFGIVALEAMAAGTPIVASDAGGLGEIVRHDKNGTSCHAGDSASLAWAIRAVLSDPHRARKLAGTAKEAVVDQYSWRIVADHTIKTYIKIYNEYLGSSWSEASPFLYTAGSSSAPQPLPAFFDSPTISR